MLRSQAPPRRSRRLGSRVPVEIGNRVPRPAPRRAGAASSRRGYGSAARCRRGRWSIPCGWIEARPLVPMPTVWSRRHRCGCVAIGSALSSWGTIAPACIAGGNSPRRGAGHGECGALRWFGDAKHEVRSRRCDASARSRQVPVIAASVPTIRNSRRSRRRDDGADTLAGTQNAPMTPAADSPLPATRPRARTVSSKPRVELWSRHGRVGVGRRSACRPAGRWRYRQRAAPPPMAVPSSKSAAKAAHRAAFGVSVRRSSS